MGIGGILSGNRRGFPLFYAHGHPEESAGTQRKWEVSQCSSCTEYVILKVFQYGERADGCGIAEQGGKGMNICIVDDDRYLVEKIAEGMEWEKWNIEGVFTAYNIKQAKEILSTMEIDILLSDIEMPQGSGLELLRWVREQKLGVECIYLSSYAHFAYAQKALELHSRAYLLKPVSNKELGNVLDELVRQMKLERGAAGEGKQRAKENYWRNLLVEKEPDGNAGKESGNHPEGYGEEDFVLLGLLRIFHGIKRKKIQDNAVFCLTLKHAAEEIMHGMGMPLDVMFQYSDDCFLLVLKNGSEETEELKNNFRELLLRLKEETDASACIYIGKRTGTAERRAQLVLLFEMMHEGVPGDDGLLLLEEWTGRNAVYDSPDFAKWEQRMMYSQDMAGVLSEITDYVDALCRSGAVNVGVLSSFKADLQQMVFHYMMENGITLNQIFEAGEFDYYCDKASLTSQDMKEFVSILFKKLKAVLKVDNTEESVVEQIVRYIDDNLAGDLSRANLASRVYISEDYLSKKFAVYTGMSIPNFVSKRRMERACDYFKNTLYSVSEVAMMVGYSNFSYFSKTFRDYAGCTPNEYKSRNSKGNLTKI